MSSKFWFQSCNRATPSSWIISAPTRLRACDRRSKRRGAKLLYLPAYSPDLNPIEMAFAKLKSLLRKKALRTIDAVNNALGAIADVFTPEECRAYLRHAGYFRSA
jgi:transposase